MTVREKKKRRYTYCPVCGYITKKHIGELECVGTEFRFSRKLSEQIMRALASAKEVQPLPRRSAAEEKFFCPGCRGDLLGYTKFDRYFKCSTCDLELKAMAHFELEESERRHAEQKAEFGQSYPDDLSYDGSGDDDDRND